LEAASKPAPTSAIGDAAVASKLGLSLSAEDIAGIITAAIRASKEPTPEEKAAAEKLEAEIQIKRKQMLEEAEGWRVEREALQANCSHKKPRGEEAYIGKLFSDGNYRIMCLQCQKIIRDIKASPEMMAQVMQAESLGACSWENFAKMPGGFVDQLPAAAGQA